MTDTMIRNCKFRYRCDENWRDMERLDEGLDKIRLCRVCNEKVYRCDNDRELAQAMKNNLCVALMLPDEAVPTLIGDVDASYFAD
jgi:hypothetical protein